MQEAEENRITETDDASQGNAETTAVAFADADVPAVGFGTVSAPVGQGPCPCREDATQVDAGKATADGWIETSLTNDEAAAILRGADSGIAPDLSRRGYRLAKRAFDVCASGIAVLVLLVPSLALSAVICAKSPGAGPLYSQLRVGRVNPDGTYRLFRMYKFRSMVPNADGMLGELAAANEADGPLFKIKDDPRVIPGVGAFIRRHSIDELPQLLNVLKGDMSLIGPRPGLPREVAQYGERAKIRLTVKPGCGGAWQAGGRS
ncbi:MAG: sugar transferase, partial [Eggerthellaceae bacterium]|nr:sugar transferase [Eggerthellaceae bacterium]